MFDEIFGEDEVERLRRENSELKERITHLEGDLEGANAQRRSAELWCVAYVRELTKLGYTIEMLEALNG